MNSRIPQPQPAGPAPCRVSIVVKALNEEKSIRRTIESCLKAVSEFGGEVILADSCSTDRTVELAAPYPIRIVQLVRAEERSCGAGPQLGYQHSTGDYVYIIDGDMQMVDGFLDCALNLLAQHPEVAGVGGRVIELNNESMEYRERGLRAAPHLSPGEVDRLDGGGLYRRRAIEEAGFFSDRNLHSYEEFDLAARLRSRGWKLWRLPVDAVTHFGHDAPPYSLLMRRWRTGYICGHGELLRAAFGQPHWRLVWRGLRELRLYVAVLAWWAALLAIALLPIPVPVRAAIFTTVMLAPVAAMSWRKRSLSRGVYSVVSWCFNAAGLVRGVVHNRRPVRATIASRVIREPLDTFKTDRGAGPDGGMQRNRQVQKNGNK